MIFFLDFHLSKTFSELGQQMYMHLYFLVKFTKCFRQVKQVKVLKNDFGDLYWPLNDAYKLIVYSTLPTFSEIEVWQ